MYDYSYTFMHMIRAVHLAIHGWEVPMVRARAFERRGCV
jgi:hypothetical protein